MSDQSAGKIMSVGQAKAIERSIIALCLIALVSVIQPFSLQLYGIGLILCFVGGLAFNLVPFCRAGKTFKSLYLAAGIVVIVFVIFITIALGVTELYALSLKR